MGLTSPYAVASRAQAGSGDSARVLEVGSASDVAPATR